MPQAVQESVFRNKWDIFKLKMPIFGSLNRMVAVSNYIRSFALLTSVGVPLIDALDVANRVVHNRKIDEITQELKKAVEGGNLLSKTLRNYDIFPPVIVQLAVAGEEAGITPEMLNKGADFLDKDIERTVNALLVRLEPVLTLIMGAVIGFLADECLPADIRLHGAFEVIGLSDVCLGPDNFYKFSTDYPQGLVKV